MNPDLPEIQHNVSLANYSTMKLGGTAAHLCAATSPEQLAAACRWAKERDAAILVIGGGSNIVFGERGFDGLVIVNQILGFETVEEDADSVTLRVGAGEDWDLVVKRTVDMNLSGIESLSLIPGSAGGTPIQNVGAYGEEIANTLVNVEVYDLATETFEVLVKDDLGLTYRSSKLKVAVAERRYAVIRLTLKLSKTMTLKRPLYDSLETYFDEHTITELTPQTVREAVIAIRQSKLPDPAVTPNTGSFFANPIVDTEIYEAIKAKHPNVKAWPVGDKYKLAAGWLIEEAGLKDYAHYGMKTHDKQALVLVNESAKTASDLMRFRDEIIAKVKDEFNVTLQQEPELIGE